MDIKMYVITHKKYENIEQDSLYVPLLVGGGQKDYGYCRDDAGENISSKNKFYAELTGLYWIWKNSNADVVGICHYRRYFLKGMFKDILNKEDIQNILNDFDIIVPQRTRLSKSVWDTIESGLKMNPDYGAKLKDYKLMGEVINEISPEYYDDFNEYMNGKVVYSNNMFVAPKKLIDDYCFWLFSICEELEKRIDFSHYPDSNKRVLGFFGENLFSIWLYHNDFKIKECYVKVKERKISFLQFFVRRFPLIARFETFLSVLIKKYH